MKTTTNNTNIKNLLGNGEIQYDHLFTEGQFQWFKSDADAYIYVLNTETKRATRYNAEAQNGKRISVDEFESKMVDMFRRVDEAKEPEITPEDIENDARELERYLKVEEEQTTEEVKEIQKKMKKTRKSKDIAWAGDGINAPHTVTLTAKQVDFIKHLPDTYFWEDGIGSVIWVDCLCDDIGGQFAGKPMTVGAMISTLCEKGLGQRATNRRDNRKCISFALTELGKKVAKELGLR